MRNEFAQWSKFFSSRVDTTEKNGSNNEIMKMAEFLPLKPLIIPPAYEVCHGGIMFLSFLCLCVCVCLLTIFVSAP